MEGLLRASNTEEEKLIRGGEFVEIVLG
jgi:hypothetical protein